VTLRVLEPPYTRLLPAGPFRPPVGAILVADLSEGIPALAEAVVLQREAPWCPLVTCLQDRRVSAASLTAFEPVPGSFAPLYRSDYLELPEPARILLAVRRRPPPLATTVAQWTERRLGRPGVATTLGACFGDNGDALRPPRTLTRRVRSLGALEVRDWRGLCRLTQIMTAADGFGLRSLEGAALAAEIDPRTLRRWLRLATDLPWSEATARAGWEWTVEMTLRRFGYVVREVVALVSGDR